MANIDIKEVRDCYATLRDLVIHNSGGWDNAESRRKVERLCSKAIAVLNDAECQERLRTVKTQAEDLFSREGHVKWSRKNMTGADYLRLQMLISLEALNTRLYFIDAIRQRTTA